MELYEELPDGQIQEELYEDLPAGPYDGYPNSSPSHSQSPTEPMSPPPLPTSRPPSFRPPGSQPVASGPPIPQRSPSTTLSTSSTLPSARRKGKPDAPKKSTTLKSPSSSGGGGGGGIDMNEIVKKARMRDISAFENLESKRSRDDEEGGKHVAPWLNQLRKSGVPSPKLRQEEDKGDVPPWVKRKAAVEKPLPHRGTENGEEEIPELFRKMRKMSFHEDEPTSPPPTHKPPPPLAAKPRTVPPPITHPKPPAQEPQTAEKPPWLKQRERQANLSKLSRDNSENEPPRPSIPPKPKPAPPNGETINQRPPTPTRKPKPVPTKVAPKPPVEAQREEEGGKMDEKNNSPPLTPGSIRDRAKTLEMNMGIGGRTTPPSPSPKAPTRPKPLPRSVPKKPTTPEEQIPPPVPIRRETTQPTLPPAPPVQESTAPNTVSSPPLPVVPPRITPSITTAPPLLTKPPLSKPPLSLPASRGEPTPPMVSVQRFRRRPLEIVDLNHPPPVPTRLAKPHPPAVGYLKKDITQRTAYQSAKEGPQEGPPVPSYPDPEDIYESLPDGAPQDGIALPPPIAHPPPSHPPPGHPPPSHPPPSHPPPSHPPLSHPPPGHPPPSHPPPTPTGPAGIMRFPPPSQPPPPPPPEGDDEPEENYEYLPDQ